MAFEVTGDIRQDETMLVLLESSLTFYVGDVVAMEIAGAGTYNVATNESDDVAGDLYPAGVLLGFAYGDGSVYPYTGQDPTNTPNQVTTAAGNPVAAKPIYGVMLPIRQGMKFIGLLSAAAGTTGASAQPFVSFNLSDARTIGESTVQNPDPGTAPYQVTSLGVVPGTSSLKIYCQFNKSQLTRP